MSGSPVYIDNKLVGAIAFSFPFSKVPIAGITPIQQMIDLFEKGSVGETPHPKEPRAISFAQLASTGLEAKFAKTGDWPDFTDSAAIGRLVGSLCRSWANKLLRLL